MAIYTNEHLTDLLNDEYEKVRKLEQELQKTKAQLIGVTEQLKQQLEEAVGAIKYLYPNVDRMFKDIPEGLSPMFYHTLSYDGDMKVRDRLDNIANFLAKHRGGGVNEYIKSMSNMWE